MKDGELLQRHGRWELRFSRELAHPVDKVWTAITSPEGLSAWFPFDVVGPREAGAGLRFVFRAGEGPEFTGSMVEYEPKSVMELRWEGDETLRLELAEAARDAAGWHACLDVLEGALSGEAGIDSSERWQAVHPAYVSRFGPDAA